MAVNGVARRVGDVGCNRGERETRQTEMDGERKRRDGERGMETDAVRGAVKERKRERERVCVCERSGGNKGRRVIEMD